MCPISQSEELFVESEITLMSYDIFHSYGLDKIHDSFAENYDYKDVEGTWKLVKSKPVVDSDGFNTEYTWYTNGDKHIFMFGDSDLYEPDEDYADWVTENEQEASDWFDNYTGFEDDSDIWSGFEEDDLDETYTGNANFLNDAFSRVYGEEKELEE